MSWRCIVIEDERPARQRLKRLLAEHPDFEVVAEAEDAATAVRLIDELAPDLCFVDVQMPEGDGFDVLRRVKKPPRVIFTTAFDQYAVRAFEVNSLDYLLKPFGKRRLAEALDRARADLTRGSVTGDDLRRILETLRRDYSARGSSSSDEAPLRVTARRGQRIVLLEPDEISWFESEDTLVFACTDRGRFLVERTLTDIEQHHTGFFRSHRRYLVNLERIAEIVPDEAGTYRITLRGEKPTSVPLSRRQARKLRERIPW